MAIYELDGIAPELPAEYWVAPDAQVMGRVILGQEVGIWFGAVLRADNEPMRIGARSNIQDGAVLHSDVGAPLTVGEDCTVGHRAILHGCTVGDCSLIGMGATVLNKAKIGRFCIVGANALVTERKEFPDYSLIVGSPAVVVRTFDEAVVAQLKRSAEGYVRNWRRFKAGLKPIS
ncbi:MAG: gamma carbonic anhydrase family protein [Alphaproteobacteria bacterium]|nr:gamma carbonic anhydrase family protein [Alphaproteobacteria bacterium]